MEELLGIEKLKTLTKFACDLTRQFVTSLADGWQWTDSISFLDEAIQIPGIARSFPLIKAELADLSPAERLELAEYLQEEFDIPNDKLELAIESSIMQAISLITLYEMWKDIKTVPDEN